MFAKLEVTFDETTNVIIFSGNAGELPGNDCHEKAICVNPHIRVQNLDLKKVTFDDFYVVFSKMSLCSSETVNLETMDSQCICFSGVDADCSDVPDGMLMKPEKRTRNARFLSRFVDAGVVLNGNCIPYLTGFIPLMGEHFVSCESSAVLFMNSVWGACGNGDGIEASFCAAVCGRTPLAGNPLHENRIGTDLVVVNVEPKSGYDWHC